MEKKYNYKKLIVSDIDGTLLKHWGSLDALLKNPTEVLPGVYKKLQEWAENDYHILLVTGRKPSMKDFTIKQLSDAGIFFDDIIFGCGRNQRILINDSKLDSDIKTAIGIMVERNIGMENLEI